MKTDFNQTKKLHRRAFLQRGNLVLLAGTGGSILLGSETEPEQVLRVGLITDLHYADKPPAGTRHYRETLDKLAEAAEQFSNDQLELIVELGDLIDAADSVDVELGYLRRINREYSAICKNRHYVLGNHCVYTLTKEEFLGGVQQKRSYYSFDASKFHFVVLDSCFRSDGQPYGRRNFQWTDPNIPEQEVEWLRADLQKTSNKTIVFAHQRLDVSNHYGVKNAVAVRTVLEQSDKVLAVFQGHSHRNDYKEIGGIHYCTLVAMVEGAGAENNGYSVMSLDNNGTIRLQGFRNQADRRWQA